MSWNQLQTLFGGQGLVFWAAVTAVALGLTMLSVSIVFQLRKVLERTAWPKRQQHRAKADSSTTPRPQVVVTADGYQATGLAQKPDLTAPQSADPLLESLLARLKKSGDRLERLHSSLGPVGASRNGGADSLLKAPSDGVDYVYQAGRA